jgi:hypothetical protein
VNGRLTYRKGDVEIVIDLFAPDYGHPHGREIVEELHGNIRRSDPVLFCEATGRPAAVYLFERNGCMYGGHFDGSACSNHSPSLMSDEHKRQVEYVVRAASDAGHSVDTEVSLGTGARPDVVIYGQDKVAIEVQRSHLTKRHALTRTAKTMRAGLITSAWITDRDPSDRPAWFGHVPSSGMNKLPWDVTPPGRAATAVGLREVYEKRCSWPEVQTCPVTKGRPCGGWHAAHRPWTGKTVDDIAEMAPQRGIVPLNWFGKWTFLVSPESCALYESMTGRSSDWRPSLAPPSKRPRRRIECAKPVVATEIPCCGQRSPGIEGEPLRLSCQLCPTSPTYWRQAS